MSASDREEPAPKGARKGAQRTAAKEAPAPAKDAPAATETAPRPAGDDENPWVALAQKNAWILIPLLVPAAIVVGMLQGAQAVLLLLIGAALVGVIALFWNSLRTLLGETPLTGADAYALAAPRAEEEQKQAVLRALKDLEFERSVGKISDVDYAILVAKYRAEAKRLLRSIEEEARPRRESVEWLVHERLAKAGLAPRTDTFSFRSAPAEIAAKAEPAAGAKKGKKKMKGAEKPVVPPREVEITPEETPEKKPIVARPNVDTTLKSPLGTTTKESPVYVPPSKNCASCGVKNDPDANFCKKCGSKSFEGPTADRETAKPEVEPSKAGASKEQDSNAEAAENEPDSAAEAQQ